MKQLLITADDYGVHSVVDNGIRKCIDTGAVNCVDVIVTHYTSSQRIRKLIRDYNHLITSGDLIIGLHLSVTCGTPMYTKDNAYMKDMSVRRRFNGRVEFKHATALSLVPRMDKLLDRHFDSFIREMYAQYDRFVEITGFEPKHVSSHIGFYTATKELFEEHAAFCKDKSIWMRCPTLLGLNKKPALRKWTNNPKQKLLPEVVKKIPNGSDIWEWVQDHLPGRFSTERTDGMASTDYFIEHFFKQGSPKNLDRILKKVDPNGYEMVVHPVWFKNKKEYDSMPRGIRKNAMGQRKTECETLSAFGNRDAFETHLKNTYGIERMKIA